MDVRTKSRAARRRRRSSADCRTARAPGRTPFALADGTDAVLKVHGGSTATPTTTSSCDCAAARGYPMPIVRRAGTSLDGRFYELQRHVAGEPVEQTDGRAPARRCGARRDASSARSGLARRHVARRHGQQRDVDGRRRLLRARGDARALRRDARAARPPAAHRRQSTRCRRADRDVVHYDFSPYNILADGDRITGVVDWGGVTPRRRRLRPRDARVLHLRLRGARRAARRRPAAHRPRALALYAAHMVLRQVDWSLRHRPVDVDWFVGIGSALLAVGDG